MKKLTISFLLLILLNKAYSQKFYLTPKAGLIFSNQSGSNNIKLGLGFGASLEYNATKLFSLQSGLSYVQKGYQENNITLTDASDNPIESNINIKFNYNYLEIPLLAKLNFGSQKVKFYCYTGPSLSYFINEQNNRPDYFNINNDNKNKLNLGWQAGIGCKLFLFGPGAIVFDTNFDLGISKVFKDGASNIRNNYFAFNVGYAFPLGKK